MRSVAPLGLGFLRGRGHQGLRPGLLTFAPSGLKTAAFVAAALLLVCNSGCNREDAATLGRIGERLEQRAQTYLKEGKNGDMIKSLPLLQQPHPKPEAVPANAGANK